MKYRFRDKNGRFKKPTEIDFKTVSRYGHLYNITLHNINKELIKVRNKAYEA